MEKIRSFNQEVEKLNSKILKELRGFFTQNNGKIFTEEQIEDAGLNYCVRSAESVIGINKDGISTTTSDYCFDELSIDDLNYTIDVINSLIEIHSTVHAIIRAFDKNSSDVFSRNIVATSKESFNKQIDEFESDVAFSKYWIEIEVDEVDLTDEQRDVLADHEYN